MELKFAHEYEICVAISYNYVDAFNCQLMYIIDIRSHTQFFYLVFLLLTDF